MTSEKLRQAAQQTMDAFWDLARATCAEIQDFRPDLIIVLYHSGQAALRAARAAWSARHDAPFPPVVPINWGREKLRDYQQLREKLGHGPFVGFLESADQRGHLLAWLAEQPGWPGGLEARVCAALGWDANPARILVLDDFAHEWTTWISALGLLDLVYPEAETELIAGDLEGWKTRLARYWLSEHDPALYHRTAAQARALYDHDKESYHHLTPGQVLAMIERGEIDDTPILSGFDYVANLVPGTEDVAPDSLAWRPLTPASPAIQAAREVLPVETALALSDIIYARIEREMCARAQDPQAWDAPYTHAHALRRYRLHHETIVLREAWRRGELARRDVLALTDLSPHRATRLLRRWTERGFLARHGRGGATTYRVRHRLGILAYGALLADPGAEITALTVDSVPVTTPFPVEYAQSNQRRAGAPALVPVPPDHGAPVPARILLLRPDATAYGAVNILYRRAVDHVADRTVWYHEEDQRQSEDPVLIENLAGLGGLPHVFHARLKPNIDPVLDPARPIPDRAAHLAHLAVASVTAGTYPAGRDGIRALAAALDQGIRTPLSEAYRMALLRRAVDAPHLDAARRWIAREKGLTSGGYL